MTACMHICNTRTTHAHTHAYVQHTHHTHAYLYTLTHTLAPTYTSHSCRPNFKQEVAATSGLVRLPGI